MRDTSREEKKMKNLQLRTKKHDGSLALVTVCYKDVTVQYDEIAFTDINEIGCIELYRPRKARGEYEMVEMFDPKKIVKWYWVDYLEYDEDMWRIDH